MFCVVVPNIIIINYIFNNIKNIIYYKIHD